MLCGQCVYGAQARLRFQQPDYIPSRHNREQPTGSVIPSAFTGLLVNYLILPKVEEVLQKNPYLVKKLAFLHVTDHRACASIFLCETVGDVGLDRETFRALHGPFWTFQRHMSTFLVYHAERHERYCGMFRFGVIYGVTEKGIAQASPLIFVFFRTSRTLVPLLYSLRQST